MPAKSETPVLSRVMTLDAASTLAAGVSVAVHVMPPSPELTADNVPLAIVRSTLVKPVTASENVIVTKLVAAPLRELTATTIAAVGRCVSTA